MSSGRAMLTLMLETLKAGWVLTERSMAFNVMSKHVDWERDDLFHLPCDDAIAIAREHLGTRHIRILHDYGLYEYSCLISRAPIRREGMPKDWFEMTEAIAG